MPSPRGLLRPTRDGLSGRRDGDRHPSRHRRGLEHRVAKLIAGLARLVRDVGLAEELAQDALVAALEQWPEAGIPDKPGAWLMAAAKHRAIDLLRHSKLIERKHEELGRELETEGEARRPTSTPRWTTTSATTCCASSSPPAIRCSPPRRASP